MTNAECHCYHIAQFQCQKINRLRASKRTNKSTLSSTISIPLVRNKTRPDNRKPVPVAARSKAWVCGLSPVETVGSNPTWGAWMFVCCECCVLSGRGLCDELITRPGESYRLWCVVVCDLETSWMRRPWPTGGFRAKNKETKICVKEF